MTQDWTLEEALAYYRRQGAPGEQGALVALLREVQEERGGALPPPIWRRSPPPSPSEIPFCPPSSGVTPACAPRRPPTAWSCAAAPAGSAGARPVWPPLWRRPTACARAASAPAAASPTASPAV